MIPYMVGKLAPNSTYLTRLLVKYVPGRGYFWAVPSQNEDKFVTSPPSPIVERVLQLHNRASRREVNEGLSFIDVRYDYCRRSRNDVVLFEVGELFCEL